LPEGKSCRGQGHCHDGRNELLGVHVGLHCVG
jgi:hypothetical protein